MKRLHGLVAPGLLCCLAGPLAGQTPDARSYIRKDDVIYGRKDGMALTMDVFTPKKAAKGVGVLFVVSSAFLSARADIDPPGTLPFITALVDRGFTVFAVVHGSQPRFTVPDIVSDVNRSVRFVRAHAREHEIDPDWIGITGASAGGHLALMQGVAGDSGNAASNDPVERVSSRVQAVACFCPATDFLNFGGEGKDVLDKDSPLHRMLRAPLDFHELDSQQGIFVRITDEQKIREMKRQVSPITHITPDDPPTLIIHGDADNAVPPQQSKSFIAKLKRAGVPAELVIKPGAGHNWPERVKDVALTADWFDRYRRQATTRKSGAASEASTTEVTR
jgi:acetyl esterase/lipase